MSNQSDVIALIRSISGQANVLTIPRVYIVFTKSHRAALFLSQSVYWSDRSSYSAGWFYKSFKEWRNEIGLNQHAVETCVKCLIKGGWLEVKIDKVGIRNVSFYRPVLETIAESIKFTLAETAIVETANVPKRKTIRSSIEHRLHAKDNSDDRTSIDIDEHPLLSVSFSTRDIQKAYEGCVSYKIDWVRGEGHAAKWLAENGYTPNDIVSCYADLKAQKFWSDKPLSLSSLKKQIGEWKTKKGRVIKLTNVVIA